MWIFHFNLLICYRILVPYWMLPNCHVTNAQLYTLCFISYRFHHPQAEIISNYSHSEITIKEPNKDIQLEDMRCKLRFVSTPGDINHLLLTSPPTISVCDTAEGQNNQLAVAMPNIGPLLVGKIVSVIIFLWLLCFGMMCCWKNISLFSCHYTQHNPMVWSNLFPLGDRN